MARQKTLGAVIALTDNYTSKLNKIVASTASAEDKVKSVTAATDKFNGRLKDMGNESDKTSGKMNGLIGRFTTLISAGFALRKAFQWGLEGVNIAATQEVQENTLKAMLGNDALGAGLYDYVSDYAKTSILGREDLAKGMMSYLPTTKDFTQLQRLINMTEAALRERPDTRL